MRDDERHDEQHDTLYSIGELARRTGLTVKAVRFYADGGLVPPVDRTPAGYRRFDVHALARLDLVRTLRELGLDLATIRRVLDRSAPLREVAAAHADALDVQIRTLRLRRAVLRAVAERGSTTEEMRLMHKLAALSDAERRRLIDDFVDAAFGGLDANPEFVAMMRAAVPELPEDPSAEQVDAWVELGELVQDEDFRAAVRRMAAHQAAERAAGDDTGLHTALTETVRAAVTAALAGGVAPGSPAADAVVDALTAEYAATFGRPDGAPLRAWLLDRLEIADDPRAGRYWSLLGTINGWPAQESLDEVFAWFTAALRARTGTAR
ncbi:MerR family transcriptional regulator [Kitasatospora sp. NBC_00458]|uniref:MerR family transcriptional regulator n=1 Tax=Kitasatospora sp. NBC_00458 TaxID=2903568 RepID=UPI002E173220